MFLKVSSSTIPKAEKRLSSIDACVCVVYPMDIPVWILDRSVGSLCDWTSFDALIHRDWSVCSVENVENVDRRSPRLNNEECTRLENTRSRSPTKCAVHHYSGPHPVQRKWQDMDLDQISFGLFSNQTCRKCVNSATFFSLFLSLSLLVRANRIPFGHRSSISDIVLACSPFVICR